MRTSLLGTTVPFAHLLGRKPAAVKETDEPEPDAETEDERRQGEKDEDWKARVAANKARRRAEKDKEDPEAAGEEDEREAEGEEDEREAASEEDDKGDDKSDGGDMRKKGIASARRRERARCAAIFDEPAAFINPALAATLAFKTDLSRREAITCLRVGGMTAAPTQTTKTPRASLDERMQKVTAALQPLGAGDASTGGKGSKDPAYENATNVIIAGMKRRGESEKAINEKRAERAAAA